MGLIRIDVIAECDNCGKQFKVDMDTAEKSPDGWSIYDEAIDSIRGGVDYRELNAEDDNLLGTSSYQDEQILCDACTTERDKLKITEATNES